jgi:hypothetical protein
MPQSHLIFFFGWTKNFIKLKHKITPSPVKTGSTPAQGQTPSRKNLKKATKNQAKEKRLQQQSSNPKKGSNRNS